MIPHYFLDLEGRLNQVNGDGGSLNIKDAPTSMAKRLALIDRDGVVVEKAPRHQYHKSKSGIKLIEGAGEAIGYLNSKNIPVVLITNQPGIYKGFFGMSDLVDMNDELSRQISPYDAKVDSVFFCPHAAPAEGDVGAKACGCRKPLPGMLNAAVSLYSTSKNNAYMFGDFRSDILAAERAGVSPVYIATRHDEFEDMQSQIKEHHPLVYETNTYSDLHSAVKDVFG